MENQNEIIDRINELVSENRKTQTGFAKMVGLDPAGFTRMMRGELTVTDKTLNKIAECCGVRFGWLLSGEGEKYSIPMHQNAQNNFGGTAQAQGDGASAEVNTDSTALIALIATYQQQIEKMQADARAEREKILDDARKEREFLYSLIKEMKP